jgi:hypothetical protein
LVIDEEATGATAVEFRGQVAIVGSTLRPDRTVELFEGWLDHQRFERVQLSRSAVATPPSLLADGRDLWLTSNVPGPRQLTDVVVTRLNSPIESHVLASASLDLGSAESVTNGRGAKVALYARGGQLFARAYRNVRRRPVH